MMALRTHALALSLCISLPLFAACGGAAPDAVVAPGASGAGASAGIDAKIKAAMAAAHRPAKESVRDGARHPAEVLEFFGLRDDMTVVELNPGGGWFTAILAPTLRDHGKLFVTTGDPAGDPAAEGTKHAKSLQERFAATPAVFDKVTAIVEHDKQPLVYGAPESADMVVTFRNYHNWLGENQHEAVLAAAFKVLKHGGILGLTDHRAKVDGKTDAKSIDDSGYVPEAYVIKTIEAAGFKLAGKSEVNANPKDTKDYAKGVWTLPPTYAMGDVDHAKYEAIGESDRMTLKFVKP